MRLEHPHRTERFGAVHIRELQRVVELDSGEERLVRRADDLGPTCSVRLTVGSVYPGDAYDDVAVSDVVFHGTRDADGACDT